MDFGAVSRVLQNVPKVTVNADLLTGVNRNCSPIGANDFESFATAFSVGADMELGTVAHFEIDTGELPDDLGFPLAYDFPFFTHDFVLPPSNGTGTPKCLVIVDDSETPTVTVNGNSPATVQGVPGATGTMFVAESAVPTWDFGKIESYSSANGHLPTNVNYKQMLTATTVPTQVLNAVQAAAKNDARRLASSWKMTAVVMVFAALFV